MLRLRISVAAQQDIDDIYRLGVIRYGLAHTDGYLTGLQSTIAAIAAMPLMARERTEVRPPIRLVPHAAHQIFYDVLATEVVIVRVLHHKANWIDQF